ncbi:MAG TPA: PIN domain-containing protein [Vicinamibacterales bacterium]|nr:PIN domain-containing protein [Vicinamibacterales bacterium]
MATAVLVALDTNVLAYAEDTNGPVKKKAALDLLDKLPPESTLIPVQALGELFSVLVKKAKRSRERARDAVVNWGDTFSLIETSQSIVLMAGELTVRHQLGWWDAVILAAAADARCRLLLSEDLQDGFTWSGVTVTNPFSPSRHPLLDAMLR